MSGAEGTNLFAVMQNRFKSLYRSKGIAPSAVPHPVTWWHSMESERKKAHLGKKKQKHSKAENVARLVRMRVISGPEVNILFLGIPFLIDCSISTIHNNVKAAQRNRAAARHPVPARTSSAGPSDATILKLKPPKNAATTVGQALPSAPHSDRMAVFRDILISYGMSEEGADDIINGDSSGEDASEMLNKKDQEALASFLGDSASSSLG